MMSSGMWAKSGTHVFTRRAMTILSVNNFFAQLSSVNEPFPLVMSCENPFGLSAMVYIPLNAFIIWHF